MRHSMLIWIALWLTAGCTTTSEVLEVSKATAINAGLLTQELQRFADDEKRFANARTGHVQQLENTLALARERFELDRLYTRETEGNGFEETETTLNEFIAKVDQVRADARASRVVVPVPETVAVDQRVKELAVLAKSMAKLADAPDRKQNLLFLKGYVESVRDYVEKTKESGAPGDDVGEDTLTEVRRSENARNPVNGSQ